MGHSSNIMQFQRLCIFHSGEGMRNFIAPCLNLRYEHQTYILKHFRNAPLTKMIVSSLIVIFSLCDNIIDKLNQLACIQYKNHNAVAHGCRDIVRILRPTKF